MTCTDTERLTLIEEHTMLTRYLVPDFEAS